MGSMMAGVEAVGDEFGIAWCRRLARPNDVVRSVMSMAASRIRSLLDDISRIQRKIADISRDESRASERVASATRNLSRASSRSQMESAQRDQQRQQDEVARFQRRRADEMKELARKQEDLARYQKDFQKEQEQEMKKSQDIIKRLEDESRRRERTTIRQFESALHRSRDEIVLETPISYSAFISHASEDKEELVRPLADELTRLGSKVWYDEFALRIGDSLRRSIDRGLANSRFGIVVLSPSFFAKNWPQYELDGLVAKEQQGHKVILPLWHRVSKDDVMKYSPTLGDRLALNTAMYTVRELAAKLHEVLQDDGPAPL